MTLMSKLTASYMAGFIDGEGYISLLPQKNKKYPDKPYYVATLKIASTDKDIIDWIQKSFGGWMYLRKDTKLHHKQAYCWSIGSKLAEPILEKIYPYLKIKRKQCELVLEKCRYHKIYAGSPRPEKISQRVQEIYEELRVLNKRGGLNVGSVND